LNEITAPYVSITRPDAGFTPFVYMKFSWYCAVGVARAADVEAVPSASVKVSVRLSLAPRRRRRPVELPLFDAELAPIAVTHSSASGQSSLSLPSFSHSSVTSVKEMRGELAAQELNPRFMAAFSMLQSTNGTKKKSSLKRSRMVGHSCGSHAQVIPPPRPA
jgi:hypothetical protein